MYSTQAEDAQSLDRIRARIVQNSKGPLPFPQFEEIGVIAGIPVNDRIVWQLYILACTDDQACLKNQ